MMPTSEKIHGKVFTSQFLKPKFNDFFKSAEKKRCPKFIFEILAIKLTVSISLGRKRNRKPTLYEKILIMSRSPTGNRAFGMIFSGNLNYISFYKSKGLENIEKGIFSYILHLVFYV